MNIFSNMLQNAHKLFGQAPAQISNPGTPEQQLATTQAQAQAIPNMPVQHYEDNSWKLGNKSLPSYGEFAPNNAVNQPFYAQPQIVGDPKNYGYAPDVSMLPGLQALVANRAIQAQIEQMNSQNTQYDQMFPLTPTRVNPIQPMDYMNLR